MLESVSSPYPSSLHPLLQLRCYHFGISPLKEGFSLVLHRLKLGRIRIMCLRLNLAHLAEQVILVISYVCDQAAGCGLAVYVGEDRQVNADLESGNECI